MHATTEKMLGQLGEITESLEGIKLGVQRAGDDDAVIRENLTHIWQVAHDLESRLARPDVVSGYRQDAIDQMQRVRQLIEEATEMDDIQFLSISLACELALEKARFYKRLSQHAARKAAATVEA